MKRYTKLTHRYGRKTPVIIYFQPEMHVPVPAGKAQLELVISK